MTTDDKIKLNPLNELDELVSQIDELNLIISELMIDLNLTNESNSILLSTLAKNKLQKGGEIK